MRKYITVLLLIVLISIIACSEKEVLNDLDDDVLLRYLRQDAMAKELFRTDSLITSDPYYKNSDPGAEFRDFVDSINRYVDQYITPDTVEKDFGPPYLTIDDAEMRVEDWFYLTTQRVLGMDTTYYSHRRYLIRWGYFLRLTHDYYSGWLLHAFNGDNLGDYGLNPRTIYFSAIKENGDDIFDGDYNYFTSLSYDTTYHIDSTNPDFPYQYLKVDTIRHQSQKPYILLSEIGQVPYGDRLILHATNVPTTIPNASVYQLVSWYSDSGYTNSQMVRTDPHEYLDTIYIASDNSHNFNLLFIQEYQYVDRHGAMWVLPYRAVPGN